LSDDNFETFASNWLRFKDRIVAFLGAGASIGARNTLGEPLMNAYDLRNELWREFKIGHSGSFDPTDLKLMSLEHAAAIVEAAVGRTVLAEYLTSKFSCALPMWQHIALSFLSPRSIFTTNYDELIELGYKHHLGQLDVVCNDRPTAPGRTVIYKPHGSLSHVNQPVGKGGLVITQFDYLEMIADYRNMLRNAMTGFNSSCVLIVGYSFNDMDIGAELYTLRKQNSGIPWYAIFPRNDPQVRAMYSKRFNVEQINMTFEDFLAELDARVDFIPTKYKHVKKSELTRVGIVQ